MVIFSVFLAGGVFAQSSMKDGQTVATITLSRTEYISLGQLRAEVERMEKSARRTLNASERREVLDEMINERLVIQAAERDSAVVFGMSFSSYTRNLENKINEQINRLKTERVQANGRQPTDAEIATEIRNMTGLDMAAFREQTRRQHLMQEYLIAKKETLIKTIRAPTEEEIMARFNLTRTQFVRPETVEFSYIRIPFGVDAASRTKARELGDGLIREIGSNPSRFDAVLDRAALPNSGYNTGVSSLPRIPEAQREYGEVFINAAFSLKQGEVSRLLETRTDYVIIKVTKNLEYKILELEDNVPGYLLASLGIDPRNTVTVRNLLTNIMALENQQTVMDQATKELLAELRAGGKTFQVFDKNLVW